MRSVTRVFLLLIAATILAATSASAKSPLTPIQQMFLLKKMKPDVGTVGIIWAESANHEEMMPLVKRAVSSTGMKLVVSYAGSMQDVASQFREMKSDHGIQALWIIDDSGVLDNDVARRFLIQNATESGIPILAPSPDWVTAGASASLQKRDGEVQIVLNKAAAAATALAVPADYEGRTQYL